MATETIETQPELYESIVQMSFGRPANPSHLPEIARLARTQLDKETAAAKPPTRRRWTKEQQVEILEEAYTTTVSATARRHNLSPRLLFEWKRKHRTKV